MGNQFEDMERAQKQACKIYLITHSTYDQRDGTTYNPVAVFVGNNAPNILVTTSSGSVWESKETFPSEVEALRWWIQNTNPYGGVAVTQNFNKIDKKK